MALPDLTGLNIEDTYQRVLHTRGALVYDGTGSLVILQLTGSFSGNGSGLTGVSASVVAAGSEFEIQFNRAGALGSNPSFTISPAEDGLIITGSLIQGYPEVGFPLVVGLYAHAEGEGTQALGTACHSEGRFTEALANYSHAEGFYSKVQPNAEYAHAEGQYTVASGSFQHVQGQYNVPSTIPSAFIVGNGVGDMDRSNLVFAAGNEFHITGSLLVSGSIDGVVNGGSF